MRWNCPHCNTLVNLELDLEQNPKSYVRCGKCHGIALIQKKSFSDQKALPPAKDLVEQLMRARNQIAQEEKTQQTAERVILDEPPPIARPEGEPPPMMQTVVDPNGAVMREFHSKPGLPKPPAFLMQGNMRAVQPTFFSTYDAEESETREKTIQRNWIVFGVAVTAFVIGVYLLFQGKRSIDQVRRAPAVVAPAVIADTKIDQIQTTSAATVAPQPVAAVAASVPAPAEKKSEVVPAAQKPLVKVRVPQAILRAGPGQGFPMLTQLTVHEILRAEKIENNWIKVEKEVYPGTVVSGWMRQDLIEIVKR